MFYKVCRIAAIFAFAMLLSADALLEGQDATCLNEGELVNVPLIADDPCIKCYCRKGVVRCQRDHCERLDGCHLILFNKPKDSCCEVCKGCVENGIEYKNGQTWASTENACIKKQCKAGVITASQSICPALNCSQVHLEGDCCPSCKTCQVGSKLYEEGQTFQPYDDDCATCTCKNGYVTCIKHSCPVLNCPENKIIRPAGQCCPDCAGERKTFTVPGMCLFRNKMYKLGETYQLNECTLCVCVEGTMNCQTRACPLLECSADLQVFPSSHSCCPVCQLKTISSCVYEDTEYQHGATWTENCVHCSCSNATVNCRKPECEAEQHCPLDTHELRFVPGNCCPVCEERYGLCTVFGDPHYVTFDRRVYDFQGTCRYTLAKDCVSKEFGVFVKNFDRYNMPGAWTKSVAIVINGTKISLQKNGKVRINRSGVSLPFTQVGVFTIKYDNLNIVVESPIGLRLIWNTESYVELHVSPRFKRNTCGLCGNYNNNQEDDFIGQDNQYHETANAFAQTWKVGTQESCDPSGISQTEVQARCQDNFSKWRRAHQECSVLKSRDLYGCQKKISVEPYYRSCVTDTCNCPKHRKCTCDAVTAYARECERIGFASEEPINYSCSRQRKRIQQRAWRRMLR